MMSKTVLALLAGPFLASATHSLPANTQEGIAADTRPEIVRVQCFSSSGTAFYVSPNVLLSVAHVTDDTPCRVGGKPFRVVKQEGDFSVLQVDEPSAQWLRIDCRGFVRGQKYTAWGFARGLYTLTSIDILAKDEIYFGFSRLWGVFNVIPGQSGGPITPVDEPGVVTGTVNVYNAARGDSGSTALKDTSLCAGAQA
jgi:hypothetical protein